MRIWSRFNVYSFAIVSLLIIAYWSVFDCCLVFKMQLVSEFLQAPQRPPHSFDMGQLLEEMQQIDQQSYRQAPQRGRYGQTHIYTRYTFLFAVTNFFPFSSS